MPIFPRRYWPLIPIAVVFAVAVHQEWLNKTTPQPPLYAAAPQIPSLAASQPPTPSAGPQSSTVEKPAEANDDWHWVKAEPFDNRYPVTWNISQGIAKNVKFEGRTFSADLYSVDPTKYPKAIPAVRLKGTILNGKVDARAVVYGTDSGPESFHGTVHILNRTSGGSETDRLILSGEWDDAFLGITRMIKSN